MAKEYPDDCADKAIEELMESLPPDGARTRFRFRSRLDIQCENCGRSVYAGGPCCESPNIVTKEV